MAKSVKTGNTGRNVNVGSAPIKRSPSEKTSTRIFFVSLFVYMVLLVLAGVYHPFKNDADGVVDSSSSESEVSIVKVESSREISSEVSEENSKVMSEETSEEVSEKESNEISEETSEETSKKVDAQYSEIKSSQNFHFGEKMNVSEKEVDLLARVIMCESSICNLMEKYYVGNVLLNRVLSHDFPDSISEVVYQGAEEGEPQYASVGVLFNDTPPEEYYSIARNLLYDGVRVLDDDIVFQTGFDPSDWASVVFKTDWHYYSKSIAY